MLNPEKQQINFGGVLSKKVSRRKVLMGAIGAASIALVPLAGVQAKEDIDAANDARGEARLISAAEEYTDDQINEAKEIIDNYEDNVRDALTNRDTSILRRIAEEDLDKVDLAYDIVKYKKDTRAIENIYLEKTGHSTYTDAIVWNSFWNFWGGSTGVILPFISWRLIRNELDSVRDHNKKMSAFVFQVRPDWIEKKPSFEEVRSFGAGLSYLPPIGGKIPGVDRGHGLEYIGIKIPPDLTAEAHVDRILKMRQSGDLGHLYMHQFTVQGRLSDDVKMLGLAFIIDSPWEYDWETPLIEYDWGKVAPIVHDGGAKNNAVTSKWDLEGRTDFIQRLVPVTSPNLEELEELPYKEIVKLPKEELLALRTEQKERERLLIEAKAYQRLCLALHCFSGSAPNHIPNDIKLSLSSVWSDFSESMKNLLEEHEVGNIADVPWFYDQPRRVSGWPGLRFEADWEPIKSSLLELEEARKNNVRIGIQVRSLLTEATNRVDETIFNGGSPKSRT